MSTSRKLDDNWTKTTDATERRRIQNRLAQRNYRNNIKQRLLQLEQLDKVISKSVGLNAGTLSCDENDQSESIQQHNSVTAYSASQALATRPENHFPWISGQNETSGSSHADIPMDMTSQRESSQRIFTLNTPHLNTPLSPPSQHQQYSYFTSPTLPQERPATLGFSCQLSDQASLPSGTQSPYQQQLTSTGTKTQTSTQIVLNTPPGSDKGSNGSPFGNATSSIAISQYPASSAGGTPLHQAAANGHLHILRFLVSEGANLTAHNEAGQTALHLAAAQGHEGIIKYTLSQSESGDAKAFIDWVDHQGLTALHRAAAGGHEECVRLLVEAGAEIEGSNR